MKKRPKREAAKATDLNIDQQGTPIKVGSIIVDDDTLVGEVEFILRGQMVCTDVLGMTEHLVFSASAKDSEVVLY